MNTDDQRKSGLRGPKTRGCARVTASVADKDRRAFLKIAMAQGVAAPAALAAMQGPAAAACGPAPAAMAQKKKGAMRPRTPGQAELHAGGCVVRDFADPELELLRLLREAAEVEHALMLQYLFAAFSLRQDYADLAGYGAPDAESLLGVAIQEMQHLGAVNRLLVALGSSPHLDRQDFPYEPDIYPFAFALEPVSRTTLAKYAYTEAPIHIFDPAAVRSVEDEAFRQRVLVELGGSHGANQVGSLYRCVLDMLGEVAKAPDAPITPGDAETWTADLVDIMEEGEDDHYRFFREAFDAQHTALTATKVTDPWGLRLDDPAYPAHMLPANPTAFIGHPNQIAAPEALVLAWLGNLHYWASLASLHYGYCTNDDEAVSLALTQMMSAIWPLATALPAHKAGMPFDPLSMGYALGRGPDQARRMIAKLGREAQTFARSIEHRLPAAYDLSATEDLIAYMKA